jgi:hypothetical protein
MPWRQRGGFEVQLEHFCKIGTKYEWVVDATRRPPYLREGAQY